MGEWTKFSDSHPTESGEYWIYRDRNRNFPRIVQRDFSFKRGWITAYSALNIEIPKDWTHWMKVEKPKAPK